MHGDELATLAIERIGVRGDGVAQWRGESVFVPFTAPGDVVEASLGRHRGEGRTAKLRRVVSSGARAAPTCVHFGQCGGCALQHLDPAAYVAAKEAWLSVALVQHGLAADVVHPLRRLAPGTRRRARFGLEPGRLGFHARASHRVVDLHACPVLHPQLLALVSPLRKLTRLLLLPGTTGAANATVTDNGIDLVLELPEAPNLARLEAMACFAEVQDLARLFWNSGNMAMPVALRRTARVTLSGVAVDLPEDGFLQPSIEAEAALVESVLDMIGAPRRVADLYAGIGTFAFALAHVAKVHAVEGSEAAVRALSRATGRARLAGIVSSEKRDLAVRPLSVEESNAFDALVFDPPYAGAKAQSRELATSRINRLVAVSCNPASFARDARILVDGGYRLTEVRPFDAFIWSDNLELVASFDRE